MRIAGASTSMIDYPDHAAVIIFLAGCNFRCPYCHNHAILNSGAGVSGFDSGVKSFVMDRTKICSAMVVSGGEPTLNEDLQDLLYFARGLNLLTGLHTNGSNPSMLADLLANRLLDYVAMDIKATPNKYDAITGVKNSWAPVSESLSILMQSDINLDLRTTCHPSLLTLGDLNQITKMTHGYPVSFKPARINHGVLDPQRLHGPCYLPSDLPQTARA